MFRRDGDKDIPEPFADEVSFIEFAIFHLSL